MRSGQSSGGPLGHGVPGTIKIRVEEKDIPAIEHPNDAINHLASLASAHPDNPVTETGVPSELAAHGIRSRRASSRADKNHQWMDPLLVTGPWLLAGGAAAVLVNALRNRWSKGRG